MKQKKSRYSLLSSIVLLLVFTSPSLFNLGKVFENHDHEVCTENTAHFHQKDDTCFTCSDFNFSSFKLNSLNKMKFVNKFHKKNEIKSYLLNFSSKTNKTRFLRGPPIVV